MKLKVNLKFKLKLYIGYAHDYIVLTQLTPAKYYFIKSDDDLNSMFYSTGYATYFFHAGLLFFIVLSSRTIDCEFVTSYDCDHHGLACTSRRVT